VRGIRAALESCLVVPLASRQDDLLTSELDGAEGHSPFEKVLSGRQFPRVVRDGVPESDAGQQCERRKMRQFARNLWLGFTAA
jgi:hypothetical protein